MGASSSTRREDELKTRLEALRITLQRTDRILSGRPGIKTRFEWAVNAPNPAYSIGEEITIFLDRVKGLHTSYGLVLMLGLNYHELAHVMFTPQESLLSSLSSYPPRFREAYNVLEEARAEAMLSADHARLKKYFIVPVVEYLVKDPKQKPVAHLLLHGRRYVPRNIREHFRAEFAKFWDRGNRNCPRGRDYSAEFARIIDAYRVLPLGSRKERLIGVALIEEFAKLLEEASIPPMVPCESTRTGVGAVASDGSVGKPTLERLKRQADEEDEEEAEGGDASDFPQTEEAEGEDGEEGMGDEPDDAGPSGDDAQDAGPDGDGEAGEDEDEEGSGSGDDLVDDEDSGESDSGDDDSGAPAHGTPEHEDPADPEGETGGGDGTDGEDEDEDSPAEPVGASESHGAGRRKTPPARTAPATRQELQEAVESLLEDLLDDDDVQEDVSTLQSAMDDQEGLHSTLPQSDRGYRCSVSTEMQEDAQRLAYELRQLWGMMEPGWNFGQPEGRVNMNRASMAGSAEDYESIYDSWDEGVQENSGICVVILGDESYSMRNYAHYGDSSGESRALVMSKSIWKLMWALQEVEAQKTVITYDDTCRQLYSLSDSVENTHFLSIPGKGNTVAYAPLCEARRILNNSEMRNKLLIVLSDGEWSDAKECPPVLDEIDATKLAVLIGRPSFSCAPKFDIVYQADGSMIFPAMAKTVVAITERNLNR